MEKKNYVHPMTEVVLVKMSNHLLEGSPIGTGQPDQPADSRSTNSSWDNEE